MGWVNDALAELDASGTASICPQGGSMRGCIESGQRVTLSRCRAEDVQIGDAVLVKFKGNVLLHLIHEISDRSFLIGNNRGKINGWIPKSDLIAKVTEIGKVESKQSQDCPPPEL